MIYAFKNQDGEIHISSTSEGYEGWDIVDQTDSEIEHPVGVSDGKLVSLAYVEKRKKEYPSLEDQLDMIYHDMGGWKAKISEIKAKFPKS